MGFNVAILGASDDKERYSNKALHMLLEYKHQVFPIHPKITEISGCSVFKSLDEVTAKIHTLTIYVRPELSSPLKDSILKMRPERVIFNPGTENTQLAIDLQSHGIKTENACTLVLLRTGQF